MPGALVFSLLAAAAGAAPPALTLAVSGEPERVIAAEDMDCVGDRTEEGLDVTDVPVTAFRRADGQVVLLTGNSNGFHLVGPTVEKARRQNCDRLLASARNADPSLYRDKEWVLALHSPGGNTVWGFVHNEYHGETHGERDCVLRPSNLRECWMSSVTWVRSDDGGRTFVRPPAPRNLVISLPFEYKPGMRRAGVGMPKVVRFGPYLFLLASYGNRALTGPGGQCLLRAPAAAPEKWEVWTGAGFVPVPGSPYTRPDRPDGDPCLPVIDRNVLSVKLVTGRGLFLALVMDRENVWYTTSPDLIDWSDLALLMPRAAALSGYGRDDIDDESLPKYFSLLDPTSRSTGFDTLSDRFYVYYVQYRARDGQRVNSRRDVYRIPVVLR
jgi:hypothetical protein